MRECSQRATGENVCEETFKRVQENVRKGNLCEGKLARATFVRGTFMRERS